MKRHGQVVNYHSILVVVFAILLLLSAAAGVRQAVAAGEPYKVGFVNHLTGDMGPYGQSLKKGTELAVEQINAAGGIKGHPIEVIYEDDRGQAADAITAFTKLVSVNKVPVVLGSASSTITLAICSKAQESKVVLVSSVSTSPALKECGKYFFSMMVSDDAQGEEWVKVAGYLKVKEAALMYINNDYGNGVRNVFVKAFQAAGGKLLIQQPFEIGGKDFRTEVLKVKQTNPSVVFIVDHTAEGSIVLRQAKELQLNAQFVTDVSMVAKEVVAGAGAAAEGVMGVRAASPSGPIYEKFKADFMAKFKSEPTIWADFAYDTMMMVAKAIEAGGYTSDGIQQALFKVGETYVGPSGPKKLNPHGIAIGTFEWVQIKNGAWGGYMKK
ncbi:MAG: ABC transporter substrate-binding protein [Thermodesulfobacteriota bacterium]